VNGNSGIEIARASLPEVILMDINLPGINGYEALKILRSDPATAHIPVIAISANAMPLDVERGLKAGFFRYITKPIKVNEFIEALDMTLEFAEKNSDNSKSGAAILMISSSDILNGKVLIVDDQGSQCHLARADAARCRLCFHHVHDGCGRGLRAAPQQPLRFDPA